MKVVESISGIPVTISQIPSAEGNKESGGTKSKDVMSSVSATSDEGNILVGIPVLDNDSVAMKIVAPRRKNYIVPGVKKARASIADDQELDEIVVVGGRPSAVASTIMGSEKFKPQLLKNIPSAFGESDIMKIALTLLALPLLERRRAE